MNTRRRKIDASRPDEPITCSYDWWRLADERTSYLETCGGPAYCFLIFRSAFPVRRWPVIIGPASPRLMPVCLPHLRRLHMADGTVGLSRGWRDWMTQQVLQS